MSNAIYSKKTNAELIALTNEVVANKALYDARVLSVDASLAEIKADAVAEKAVRDADKSQIDASLNAVNGRVDALISSTASDTGALSSRVTDLENKVGADLTATINTALDNAVIKQTLDDFLAKDTEVATAVAGAVADRVNVDNEIKTKFDLLVDTLFEGLTFDGVTKSSLQFNPST